jgi:ABC-type oligopeptide transport system substrate-binding subunit
MQARVGPGLVIGIVAAVFAGCSAAASTDRYFGKVDPPAGQVLRYISGSEPESLDPQIATGQPEARILMALYEGLTEIHPRTGQPIPAIASSWEANADNTAFTFHLRPDARFSDGSAITAADFVYSFRRGLEPALAARNAYLALDIVGAEAYNSGKGRAEDVGVDALDAHTLRIRLRQPVPFLPGLVTNQFFKVVPRRAIEAYGDTWTRPGHLISSGAFVLETWRPYDVMVVARNPMYWDAKRVRLDRITFYPLEDSTTMYNLYKAGEVDAVFNHTVPTGWIESVRHFADYQNAPELANMYVLFNTTKPPMNDVRVRKAFNAAIDKVGLGEYLHSSTAISSFVPPGIFDDYPYPSGDPYDPAKARALLAEAGYRNAAGAYDPATFPIGQVAYTYNTVEANRQVAEYLQAQWKQNLGLTVPLHNVEWRTFLQQRSDLAYEGMARGAWIGDYMDPFTFLNLFSTTASENGSGWTDATYQRLLADANREQDPHRRSERLAAAEQYLLTVQPIAPLQVQTTNFMRKPYVKGLYPNPVTLHAWKFVYIEHDPAKWDDQRPIDGAD